MKRFGYTYLFFIALLCGLMPLQGYAADVSVSASVDKTTASLEDYFLLRISVAGTRTEPVLSGLDDFQIIPRGSSSRVQIVNGSKSSSKDFNFLLKPRRAGTFSIGPFTVKHKNKTYTSDMITLTVSKTPVRNSGDDRSVYVTAEVDNKKPYVNEQIVYSFKFYRRVQVGEARLSTTPDFEGFISESLGKEREYRRVINGQTYAVTELRWSLFPVKSGVLTIGEARLDCDLVIRDRSRRSGRFNDPFFDDSFFGFNTRTERKSLRTEPLTIMVHQLPESGRPDGFMQLVGDFSLQGSLGEASVHAGDSATLTLRLRGTGTMHGLQTIELPPMQHVKVYDDKPVFETDRTGGTLIVKKAIVPMSQGELTIPAVQVPYFNPVEKKYKIASAGPFTLTVLPARQSETLQALAPAATVVAKEDIKILGQDILPIHTDLEVLERVREPRLSTMYYVLFAVPVCLYFLCIVVFSIVARRRSDSSYVRARSAWPRFSKQVPLLRSALNDSGNEFFGEAARALRDFIGDMFGVTGSALTPAETTALLTAAGVQTKLIEKIESMLEYCDAGRYGAVADDLPARQDLLKQVLQAARELRRSR